VKVTQNWLCYLDCDIDERCCLFNDRREIERVDRVVAFAI